MDAAHENGKSHCPSPIEIKMAMAEILAKLTDKELEVKAVTKTRGVIIPEVDTHGIALPVENDHNVL